MFAIANHDFGNADLARPTKSLVQDRVSFLATLLWLQKIWLIEKLGIDLLQLDEIGDVDGMSGFDPDLLKILVTQNNIAAALVLEPLYNLVGRDFFGVGLGDLFILDRAQIGGTELTKTDLLLAGGRVDSHRNVNQPEADAAFPDGTHIADYFLPTSGCACQTCARLVRWARVS